MQVSLALAVVAAVFFVGNEASAQAPGGGICSGIHVSPKDVSLKTSPETKCLVTSVRPVGCGDHLAVEVQNNCSGKVTVPAGFICEKGVGTPCLPLIPGDFARVLPKPGPDGKVNETFTVTMDDKPIAIQASYREVNEAAENAAAKKKSSSSCAMVLPGSTLRGDDDASWARAFGLFSLVAGSVVGRRAYRRRRS